MQSLENCLHDASSLVQDVTVPESKDTIAFRPQEPIAMRIVRCVIEMLASVELDHDTRLDANEVADVRADHVLAPELEVIQLTTAKPAPKQALGIRKVLTQVAREIEHRLKGSIYFRLKYAEINN